ncbi:immune inhibitor A domain-containing protein [Microbacterium sp. NPDC089698]|jgi:immune inhibitor A|uniref:immune inhibitor A domain-containing protein n=1 Tax=unclassified Microbacterium TaxID=2609290 RepID=UPI00282F989A|nr:immune inhibitor A domain-containing protein [Microbacterium sp.]MDR2321150.1 immune inhibitor A [Microbacterium sp.]
MSEKTARARRRAAATTSAFMLAAAGVAAFGAAPASAAPPSAAPPSAQVAGTSPGTASGGTAGKSGASDHYINYVAPRAEAFTDASDDQAVADLGGGASARKAISDAAFERAKENDQKHAQGNPVAAEQLAKTEAQAVQTGESPKNLKHADSTQKAKLLTILVEFDGTEDFSGLQVPTAFGATDCKPGDVQGPTLHNNIPDPAGAAHKDNNTMWVPDFSSDFYNRMLFSDEGITERVRTDLTGLDGQPGFDISGHTMKKMYEEMSRGAYSLSGEATAWVKVPHSEGYYGATVCHLNPATNKYEAGPMQDMQGHPDNPLGPGQLPIDAVAALAQQNPDFPWADYDIEDQGDRDGDGNLHEPDGIIDHVVLVHAGEDKSGGGGKEGTYAVWAHSSDVAGGATIPGTDFKIQNYIVQPENSGVGVFAHEYGHDLGLPDLYDTSNAGNSDIDFWDLMSSGSHSGPIFQSMPTHMGIWDKWVLGWVDPLEINPGDGTKTIKVGQASRPANGTEDGVKINLPDKRITLAEPHSGSEMWYSNADQDWADAQLKRSIDNVPAGATFSMWNNYVIEEDWDFGFVEVSTDGGSTWTEQKVYDESGALVSTDDGYSDPNGRMKDFGNKKYGLTGSTDGWRHDHIDLSAYAGQNIQVRLRQATDAAYEDRGWFSDDFALTAGGADVWTDDVESGDNGWTVTAGTFTDTTGAGWVRDTGTQVKAQYYLVEWRNFDGFDEGLRYGYTTVYSDAGWKVEKVPYNAPGALVWYRDTAYGDSNQVTSNLTNLPSYGAKGGLLLVDSHFDPLRRTGAAAEMDPSVTKNISSRAQSSNAAFGLTPTLPFKDCLVDAKFNEACTDFAAQAPVKSFTDDQGWVAGLEVRDGQLFNRLRDASVVVPSVDGAPYSTRVVNPDGTPATDLYGHDLGFTTLGTGNPADAGVGYGTVVTVKKSLQNNTAALLTVRAPLSENPAKPDAPAITSPANGAKLDTAPTAVSGTGVPGADVVVTLDGVQGAAKAAAPAAAKAEAPAAEAAEPTVVGDDGTWSVALPSTVAVGSHTISAVQTYGGVSSDASESTFVVADAVTPTPTPTPTTPGGDPGTSGNGNGSSKGNLAATGLNGDALLTTGIIGGALVLLATAFLVMSRRRRRLQGDTTADPLG